MKIRMNMQVLVELGEVVDSDEAVSLATEVLLHGFKKSSVETVWIGREGAAEDTEAAPAGEDEKGNMDTTLWEACIELANLGFETIVPETIDGLALNEMSLMARHYLDATEFVSPEVISRVAEFVVAMLPEARRVSEETGLQENMLKARVEHAKEEIDHWKERLAAFDRGEAVNYEYPDGSPVRPIENREKILGIIEENERVVANEGR